MANLFLSLDGRIGRGQFWLGFVGLLIMSIALQILFTMFGFSTQIDPLTGELPEGFAIALFVPMLITLWPSICVYGKRYHDRNKSAWWMMIAFVPIIGIIWMIIELGFLRGTEGSNHYGSDPLA
jgi:uncharacterized membrane protein YhaH (DUF805 family)